VYFSSSSFTFNYYCLLFVVCSPQIYELEEQRMRRLEDIATVIQKEWRAHQARKYLMELREAAMAIYSGNKVRRRKSVNPNFRGDYMRLKNDKFVEQQLARLGESKILFADTSMKINRRMKPQERVFVISEKAVYNLAPGKKRRIKRRIPLTSIVGIHLSTFCDGYLVLKVKNEVDWIGELVRKTEAVTVLRDQMAKLQEEIPPLQCDST
jgi:plasmid stabilization system protein ParE